MIEWDSPDKFIGTAAAIASLAAAAATTTGGIVAAKMSGNAARDAANAQVQGANQAATLQSKAAEDALAFQKTEADRAQQNHVNTELANYGQYAERQNRIGSLGSLLGMPNRVAPPPPSYLTGDQGAPSGAAAGAGDPKVGAFIQQWQATHAPTEGVGPLADALQKAGFSNVSRYMYGQTPSDNELNIGGTKFKVLGAEKTPGAYWYVPGTNDSPGGVRKAVPAYTAPLSAAFAPTSTQLFTPALRMPQPFSGAQ